MMKKILIIFTLSISTTGIFAQEFIVPEKYNPSTPEDYEQYEPVVLAAVNWLLDTPVNEQIEKRMDANTFLMKWLSGTQKFTIDIRPQIVNFMEINPDLLMVFMCGWTKYALETGDYKNALKGNLKGVESVITYYQKNKDNLLKDGHVEKYVRMKEKGTLEEYIKKYVD